MPEEAVTQHIDAIAALLPASGGITTPEAIYTSSVAQVLTSSAFTIVDYATVIADADSTVTTGSSWHFTCPSAQAGWYWVLATMTVDFGDVARTFDAVAGVYKNGSEVARGGRKCGTTSSTVGRWLGLEVFAKLYLNVGDTIDIRAYVNAGGYAPSLEAYGPSNRVYIQRYR